MALGASLLICAACAEDAATNGVVVDGGGGSTFTEGDAAEDADTSEPKHILACVGIDCPSPWATCGETPSFKCGVNLSNDDNHCGSCDVSCVGFEPVNMKGTCVSGQCQLQCVNLPGSPFSDPRAFRDCNQIVDDGCEIDVLSNEQNCGTCGNACAAGVSCILGKCGCTPPLVECDGKCVNPQTDGDNCGTCGNVCSYMPPGLCDLTGKNAGYVCGEGECGKLVCDSGWADCNKDIFDCANTDGCEVDLSKGDPNNCGACDVVCEPEQECRNDGSGFACVPKCEALGLTSCGKAAGCRDLLSDAAHCGSCNNACPPPRDNQIANCHKGVCGVECLPGWGDCNADPADGCEVDLTQHPAHCGACGNRCDVGAGQPCIGGECLMIECDAGPTK